MTNKTKIIAGIITGGTISFFAAPVVLPVLGSIGLLGAAGTGTAISTLSGAALTSASCAAVTGTIAGTSTAITTLGAMIGGITGAIFKRKNFN